MPYRKSYMRPFRRVRRRTAATAAKRKSSYRARRAPARFAGSRPPRRYNRVARFSKKLSTVAETEIISKRVTLSPVAWDAPNSAKYQISMNLGNDSINSQTAVPQQLFNVPLIPTTTWVNGNPFEGAVEKNYRFIKRNTAFFQIKMANDTPETIANFNNTAATIKFQFLAISPRASALNDQPSPDSDLFMTEAGDTTGYNATPSTVNAPFMNTLDVQTYLKNKKKYVIRKQAYFTLQTPQVSFDQTSTLPQPDPENHAAQAGISVNQKYPSSRIVSLVSNINKRVFYGKVAGSSRPPIDLNDRIYIVVLAYNPQGHRAGNFTMDYHATTTYLNT